MKFVLRGRIVLGDGERTFRKEVEATSEKHAKELVYSLFGSQNRIRRSKIKIESIESG